MTARTPKRVCMAVYAAASAQPHRGFRATRNVSFADDATIAGATSGSGSDHGVARASIADQRGAGIGATV